MAAFKEQLLELELSGPGSQDRRNVLRWLQETYPITVHIPDQSADLLPGMSRHLKPVDQAERSFHEEAKRQRMAHEAMLPKHIISVLWKAVQPLFAGDDWDVVEMELLHYLLAANCHSAHTPSDFARNKGVAREVANFITDNIAVSIRTTAQAAELARILCYVWEGEYTRNLDAAACQTYEKFYPSMTPTEKEALLNVGPIRNSIWQRNYGFQTYPMLNLLSADIGNLAISTAEHSTFLRKAFAVLRQAYTGPAQGNQRVFKMAITKENGAAIHRRMIDAFFLGNYQLLIEAFSLFQPLQFLHLMGHSTEMLELLDTTDFPDALLSVVNASEKQPEEIKSIVRTWTTRILNCIREQDAKPQLHNSLLDHGLPYSYVLLAHINSLEYTELAKNDYTAALASRIVERHDAAAPPEQEEETGIQPNIKAARAIARYSKAKRLPPNTYSLFADCVEF